MADQLAEVADDPGRSGEVGLVDHEDVGDLEDPGLDDLDGVSARRRRDHDGGVRGLHDLQLRLADTDGLEQGSIAPGGIDEPDRLPSRRRQATQVPAGGHAPDEDPGVERVTHHPDAIAEDRATGEGARGIDGDHPDLVSSGPPALDDLIAERALAAPRGAGDPDHSGLPASLPDLTEEVRDARIAILDHPDRASQRPGLAGHQTFGEVRFGHGIAVYRRPERNLPTVTLPSAEFVIKPQVRRQRASVRRHHVRRTRVLLAFLIAVGFVLSGAVGALAYFMPAIVTAIQDTGQSSIRFRRRRLCDRGVPGPQRIRSGNAAAGRGAAGQPVHSAAARLRQRRQVRRDRPDPVDDSGEGQSDHPQGGHGVDPRDLWVPLSTGGSAKIDAAYLHGGASAAVATVEQDFHIHIDHYAWIGLLGLVNLINEVGGIDVVATNPVMDDFYPADLSGKNPYAYERVAVLPGPQHMNGVRGAHVRQVATWRPAQRFRPLAAAAAGAARVACQGEVARYRRPA